VTHVVTCFLRNGVEVLLTRRSGAVGTYSGRWAGVSGYVESFAPDGSPSDPLSDALREVREETGLAGEDVRLVRTGDPVPVRDNDSGRDWTVHPFLFEAATRAVTPNEELAAIEWVQAPAILERTTVPGLWRAYDRVRPTVADVRGDRDRGSAAVSLRALEALRDGAAALAAGRSVDVPAASNAAGTPETDPAPVVRLARALRDARPSMAAVANRVNRAMADATGTAGTVTPEAVRDAAARTAADALVADADAAHAAVTLLADLQPGDGERDGNRETGTATDANGDADTDTDADGDGDADRESGGAPDDGRAADPDGAGATGRDRAAAPPLVATLSRSGTVRDALVGAEPAVLVGESRPAAEGVGVAEALADAGLEVTLTTDAALPALVRDGVPASDADRHADPGHPPSEPGRDERGRAPEDGAPDGADARRPVTAVLVGADAVLADGSVVNKAGTLAVALAAARAGVPVYAVAATDKVRPDERAPVEYDDPASVYDGSAPVRVVAPTFDRTPADLLAGVVTESGVLDAAAVRRVAADHRRAAGWDDAEAADG
jgi:translation initiation factor 2B subunit (eIF-2B alpha/beta/delta family)